MKKIPFRSKEVSWLSFNSRVLQEAANPSVPIIERLRFLGIYSNNLDEFFRVRIATLKRLRKLGKKYIELGIPNPSQTLKEATKILGEESLLYNKIYHDVFEKLDLEGIKLISDEGIPDHYKDWLSEYFHKSLLPRLMPIIIKKNTHLYDLKDSAMYLLIQMSKTKSKDSTLNTRHAHALIEIPTEINRFVVLPKIEEKRLVIYLDDIIRFGLPVLLSTLPYNMFDAYAIKFTRDAEIDFDNDFTESYFEKVSVGVRARDSGSPVRINYDKKIPQEALDVILKKLKISRGDDSLYPGAHYHNRKDLFKFPGFNDSNLLYEQLESTSHPYLKDLSKKKFPIIRKRDVLLHLPYQPFNHYLDLLREASLDPLVKSIKITQYRIAKQSSVAKALINAVRNGKIVTVVVEPRARFDETANISWATIYQNSGVKVIFGIPGLKIHAKLSLITRLESGKNRYYSFISTGNFNEETANHYTDHMLITYNQEIGKDVNRYFKYFTNSFKPLKLNHIVASPFSLKNEIRRLIQNEINNAKENKKASIKIKINNLSDPDIVGDIYRAAKHNVKIKIIARSMYSLIKSKDLTNIQNIKAISIVDRFLEHTRFFIFQNDSNPLYYISSADFLPRNFESRNEAMCPIYDRKLQNELKIYFDIQWRDNTKARVLDEKLTNTKIGIVKSKESHNSQNELSDYFSNLLKK